MDQRSRIALGIVAAYGFLFAAGGLASLLMGIVMFVTGKFQEDSAVPIATTVVGSLVTCLLAVPGLLAFLFRKKPRGPLFMAVAGAILASHALMVPFTLPGPIPITLFVLTLSAAGIWVLLVVLASRNKPAAGAAAA